MKRQVFMIAAAGVFSLSSCTKVIEVDLNKSNPQYVVEGNVTNDGQAQTVHISRSVNFDELNAYPPVTNATVVLSDDAGSIDTLHQETPGYYKTTSIHGVPGRTYKLEILVDGHRFSAVSQMPRAVTLEGLTIADQMSFGQQIKAPVATFSEPAGTGNYYYYLVHRNDQRTKTLYIDNDLANDGGVIDRSLPDADSSYAAGDKVSVELQCITKDMYDYYFSLQQTIGQNSATPANPVTNISGDHVLGYFSVHTADKRELFVP